MSSIPTKQIDGDVSVGRNISAGGDASVSGSLEVGHNVTVHGWLTADSLNLTNKGLFSTLARLKAAYPAPHNGWFAGVAATRADLAELNITPQNGIGYYRMYVGENGAWQATPANQLYQVTMTGDLATFQEDLDLVRNDLDETTAIANQALEASDTANHWSLEPMYPYVSDADMVAGKVYYQVLGHGTAILKKRTGEQIAAPYATAGDHFYDIDAGRLAIAYGDSTGGSPSLVAFLADVGSAESGGSAEPELPFVPTLFFAAYQTGSPTVMSGMAPAGDDDGTGVVFLCDIGRFVYRHSANGSTVYYSNWSNAAKWGASSSNGRTPYVDHLYLCRYNRCLYKVNSATGQLITNITACTKYAKDITQSGWYWTEGSGGVGIAYYTVYQGAATPSITSGFHGMVYVTETGRAFLQIGARTTDIIEITSNTRGVLTAYRSTVTLEDLLLGEDTDLKTGAYYYRITDGVYSISKAMMTDTVLKLCPTDTNPGQLFKVDGGLLVQTGAANTVAECVFVSSYVGENTSGTEAAPRVEIAVRGFGSHLQVYAASGSIDPATDTLVFYRRTASTTRHRGTGVEPWRVKKHGWSRYNNPATLSQHVCTPAITATLTRHDDGRICTSTAVMATHSYVTNAATNQISLKWSRDYETFTSLRLALRSLMRTDTRTGTSGGEETEVTWFYFPNGRHKLAIKEAELGVYTDPASHQRATWGAALVRDGKVISNIAPFYVRLHGNGIIRI